MLEKLENFSAERSNPDEMVELSAFARAMSAEYVALGLEMPVWLEQKHGEVKQELARRTADMKAKRIREIKARMETLKTTQEKRDDLARELARLEAPQV